LNDAANPAQTKPMAAGNSHTGRDRTGTDSHCQLQTELSSRHLPTISEPVICNASPSGISGDSKAASATAATRNTAAKTAKVRAII